MSWGPPALRPPATDRRLGSYGLGRSVSLPVPSRLPNAPEKCGTLMCAGENPRRVRQVASYRRLAAVPSVCDERFPKLREFRWLQCRRRLPRLTRYR